MIACLLAATMSTASALMLTSSSLLTYNFFKPLFPNFKEKTYIGVGKYFGFITIIGGVLLSTLFTNIFEIMKLLWEFNIVIAPAFWLGVKWRRANKIGAWSSIAFSTLFFIVLQSILPLFPGVKTSETLLKCTDPVTVVRTYTAREVDVQERNKEITNWQKLNEVGKTTKVIPKELVKGDKFDKEYITSERSIFWSQGIKMNANGKLEGIGMLSLELVILDRFVDLSKYPHALNETIRIVIRTFFPFLILMIVSLLTKPENKERLDRFYARMKTPAIADRDEDAKQVNLSYENTARFDYKKMFKKSQWEFEKFDKTDISGVLWFTLYGIIIMVILYWVATLGM
jgi:solute:Na+ symporter, SSS family